MMSKPARPWTPSEEECLRAHWDAPIAVAAHATGRTPGAVKAKRHHLRQLGAIADLPTPSPVDLPRPMDLRPASLPCPRGLSPRAFRAWCRDARTYAHDRWDPIRARR